MDLINKYSDGECSDGASRDSPGALYSLEKNCTPTVEITDGDLAEFNGAKDGLGSGSLLPLSTHQVHRNVPTSVMYAPVMGVSGDNTTDRSTSLRNHWCGDAQGAHLNSFTFDEQYNMFANRVVAGDPAAMTRFISMNKEDKGDIETKKKSRKKQKLGGMLDRPFVLQSRQPWADSEKRTLVDGAEEGIDKEQKKDVIRKEVLASEEDISIFHGKESEDYQGRSWIDCKASASGKGGEDSCFLPKRVIHTWTGHSKGVNAIHFYPKSGHLLLSAGLEGKAKIWSTTGDRQCMRTYIGHSKGVRDCWFVDTGRTFLTAAYDKKIKAWDTETGAMLQAFGDNKSMAFVVRTSPEHPNSLLAGLQNKKIVQFDMRTGEIVQEYSYHLGPVNSLSFIDGGRKFVSTSDDKSIRVWEFGVPVQAKYVSDPSMHAISSACTSSNGKWWIGQSADNNIVTYSADDKFRGNAKKTFGGHSSAGYACQLGFSADDRYIFSGDGDGKLFIWDWKTRKVLRSLKAHEGVCIGSEWHPLESSRVATCGWDGTVKLWD